MEAEMMIQAMEIAGGNGSAFATPWNMLTFHQTILIFLAEPFLSSRWTVRRSHGEDSKRMVRTGCCVLWS